MTATRIVLFICLNIIFNAVADQTEDQFLLEAVTEVSENSETSQHPGQRNIVSSWVDKAQFRFNNRNNLDRDESFQAYEIRIKPKAWGQRDIETTLIKLYENQQNIDFQQRLSQALSLRYEYLLSYQQQRQKTQYLFKSATLLKKQSHYLAEQINGNQYDAQKVLETEIAWQHTLDLAKTNLSRLNSLQQQHHFPLDDRYSLATQTTNDKTISIDELKHHIKQINQQLDTTPEIQDSRLKLKVLQAENELQKTKQQIGLNLLSFEYRDRKNDETAFMFGINIPLGQQFKSIESGYQVNEANRKLQQQLATTSQNLEQLQQQLNWSIEDLNLSEQQIQRVNHYLNKDFSANPDLWLNLNHELLEYQNRYQMLKLKIYKLFIKALAVSGKLHQLPLRNWLKHQTPIIHEKANS